ncbi:MAG: hypothetical protein JW860_04520 [Sedimentisphaerales bacterium]|nr:hypothetical protein [Sedimentisphaerales bacterium]
MRHSRTKNAWSCLVFLFLAMLMFAGCSRVNMKVKAEGIESVEVNIVGVSNSVYSFWESMSMTDYWKPDNSVRLDAKRNGYLYEIKFDQNNPREQTLKTSDPVWKVWSKRKAKYWFILADIPGMHKDAPGNADARRLIIPYKCKKAHIGTIEISLESSGVKCFSLPKCEF